MTNPPPMPQEPPAPRLPGPTEPPGEQGAGPAPRPEAFAAPADPFAVVADAVDGMRDELAGLADQFRRRLLNDRETRRGLDGLLAELDHAHRAAEGRIVQPLLYDLVLVLDRVERVAGEAGRDDTFAGSVAGELLALLEKYGMTRIPVVRGPFDPATQEAVSAVAALSPEQSGDVAEVVRHGYRMDERVVRPQQVRVYTDR
ncbi:nucleotide exchange factor GrpE [Streptomyces sp. 8L]|uniref:nucleotide exchange factor GrpE n=1 Tax=Streptomyces sp. 8L TaxID=2877242 RepID=UPI001CD29BAD|nr:nucleotide exchange factor GrpE [Streptomyces sp. 8L]MCA1219544.1 nucleotide exchange factor GrpE [Streptomyces sp. 8L]